MRRIYLYIVMCLLFTAASKAQDFLNHVTAEAGAGFSFPVGTIGDHTKNGFNFVASGGPRFNRRLSLTLDFSLHYMDVKNFLESPATIVTISLGSDVRIWSHTVSPGYQFIKRTQIRCFVTGCYILCTPQV